MKKVIFFTLALVVASVIVFAQQKSTLKVFISVDMEGITGIANWEDVSREGKDYEYFRKLMTQETNAAIEGALDAGATEIVVKDAHDTARNLIPDLLNNNALLIREWSGGPKSMMEGIDTTFKAAIFIGYHAKAGTQNAILEHTMSSKNITDIKINGVSLPEAGINGLIAGYYNVPVIFVAGEAALCKQAKELFGTIETVAVKEGIGTATMTVHPEVNHAKIRAGVKKALQNLNNYKPFQMKPPYTLVMIFKNEESALNASYYPGAKRTGDWEVTYESKDLMEAITAMRTML